MYQFKQIIKRQKDVSCLNNKCVEQFVLDSVKTMDRGEEGQLQNGINLTLKSK